METQREEFKLDVQITDVTNKCLLKISSTYDAASLIYHSLKNVTDDFIPPLETDDLPIRITNPEAEPISPKANALTWVFRKTFEDFIVGLNESLVEAYKVVKYTELSKKTIIESIDREKMLKEIESISIVGSKMHIPKLIEEIETAICKTLFVKDEILSINKVRNCLVHRNGIVGIADTNNIEKKSLELRCIALKIYRDHEGEMIPVTSEDKKKGVQVNEMGFKVAPKKVAFPIGTHVEIDPNTLNQVTYTCIVFVTELLKVLPVNGYTPGDTNFELVTGA